MAEAAKARKDRRAGESHTRAETANGQHVAGQANATGCWLAEEAENWNYWIEGAARAWAVPVT